MATQETTLLLTMKADLEKYNQSVLAAIKVTERFQKSAVNAFGKVETKTKKFQTVTTKSFRAAGVSAKTFEKNATTSFNKAGQSAATFNKNAKVAFVGVQTSASGAAGSLFNLSTVAKGIITALAANQFIGFADDIQKADNQLKAVTDSAEEFVEVQGKLNDIANTTRQSVTELTSVYARFTRAGKEAGFTQEENLMLTESLTKAFKIEGNTTAEVNSTLLQLTQSFRSGRIQGEEFRAVSESSTLVLEALAKQMNVNVGDLKKLASEGKLTARTLVDGLAASAEKIDKEFSQLAPTFAEVGTSMGNALVRGFNESGVDSYLSNVKRTLIDVFTPDTEIDLTKKINEAQKELKALNAEGDGFFTDNSDEIESLEADIRSLTIALGDLRLEAKAKIALTADGDAKKALEADIKATFEKIEAQKNYQQVVETIRNDATLSEESRLSLLVGANKAALGQKLIDEKEFNEKQKEISESFTAEVAETNNAQKLVDEESYQAALTAIREDSRLTAEQKLGALVVANKAALDQKLIDEAEHIEASKQLALDSASGELDATKSDERIAAEENFIARMAELSLEYNDTLEGQSEFELNVQTALLENKLINEENYNQAVVDIALKTAKEKDRLAKLDLKRDQDALKATRTYIGAARTLASAFAEDNKAINATLIIADTAAAIMATLKQHGSTPVGWANVAAVAATGAAQLATVGGGGGIDSGASATTDVGSGSDFIPDTAEQQISIIDEGEGVLSSSVQQVTFAADGGSAADQFLAESLNEGVRRGSITVNGAS